MLRAAVLVVAAVLAAACVTGSSGDDSSTTLWCQTDLSVCICGLDVPCDDAAVQVYLNGFGTVGRVLVFPYIPTATRAQWIAQQPDPSNPFQPLASCSTAAAAAGWTASVVVHNWSAVVVRGANATIESACLDVPASIQAAWYRGQTTLLPAAAELTMLGHPSNADAVLCNVVQGRAVVGTLARLQLSNALCTANVSAGGTTRATYDAIVNITTATVPFLDGVRSSTDAVAMVLQDVALDAAVQPVVMTGEPSACSTVDVQLNLNVTGTFTCTVASSTVPAAVITVFNVSGASVLLQPDGGSASLPAVPIGQLVRAIDCDGLVVSGTLPSADIATYAQVVGTAWPGDQGAWLAAYAYEVDTASQCTPIVCNQQAAGGNGSSNSSDTSTIVLVLVLVALVLLLVIIVLFCVLAHRHVRHHTNMVRFLTSAPTPAPAATDQVSLFGSGGSDSALTSGDSGWWSSASTAGAVGASGDEGLRRRALAAVPAVVK